MSLLKVAAWTHTCCRTLISTSKKDFSRDIIAFLQQDIDLRPAAIKRLKKRAEWQALVADHSFNSERLAVLGPDLATTHFIVARGGAVKFLGSEEWVVATDEGRVPSSVPNTYNRHYKVEAVDASQTKIMHCSFDNFGPLEHFKYLNISRCPNVDDWCLDRLVDYRDNLICLDISGCEKVTERGLGTLHKLRKLESLNLSDLTNVKYKYLVALMLEEELLNCIIQGVNFDQDPNSVEEEQKQMERDMFEKYEERLNVALEEHLTAGVFKAGNIRF